MQVKGSKVAHVIFYYSNDFSYLPSQWHLNQSDHLCIEDCGQIQLQSDEIWVSFDCICSLPDEIAKPTIWNGHHHYMLSRKPTSYQEWINKYISCYFCFSAGYAKTLTIMMLDGGERNHDFSPFTLSFRFCSTELPLANLSLTTIKAMLIAQEIYICHAAIARMCTTIVVLLGFNGKRGLTPATCPWN